MARRLAHTLLAASRATRVWKAVLLVLIGVVCWLTLTPKPPPAIDFGWDKLNHVMAFMALGFSSCLSYPDSSRRRILALCAMVALGGAIEILQLYVPGRSSEWGDLLADAIGVGAGAIVAALLLRLLVGVARQAD
jgi:VanZ family protein